MIANLNVLKEWEPLFHRHIIFNVFPSQPSSTAHQLPRSPRCNQKGVFPLRSLSNCYYYYVRSEVDTALKH